MNELCHLRIIFNEININRILHLKDLKPSYNLWHYNLEGDLALQWFKVVEKKAKQRYLPIHGN